MKLSIGIIAVGIAMGAQTANAQSAQTDTQNMVHSQGMTHTQGMDHGAGAMAALPTEPGQGAFAAVAEIVALLTADPNTDWSRVNISALQQHLVDMDMLVTQTQVSNTEVEGGLEMRISLSGDGGGAASRMVPAHGPVLATETGWDSRVQVLDDVIVWRVSSDNAVDQIRALGFYGLMAVGDHHREHHMGMASGQMIHP
ncbi:MAG: hypothetical protein V3U96_06885 [Paracoccaceae bacterium]